MIYFQFLLRLPFSSFRDVDVLLVKKCTGQLNITTFSNLLSILEYQSKPYQLSRGSQERSLADSLDSGKSPNSSQSAPSSSSNRTEGYFQMNQAAQEKTKNISTAGSAQEIAPANQTLQTDLNSTGIFQNIFFLIKSKFHND